MNFDSGQYNPEISNVAKETGGNLASIKSNTDKLVGFSIPAHDDIVLSYDDDDNLTSVVYKSGGDTVATLTLTYSGSNLIRVEKS
jgi:hypothetical protein